MRYLRPAYACAAALQLRFGKSLRPRSPVSGQTVRAHPTMGCNREPVICAFLQGKATPIWLPSPFWRTLPWFIWIPTFDSKTDASWGQNHCYRWVRLMLIATVAPQHDRRNDSFLRTSHKLDHYARAIEWLTARFCLDDFPSRRCRRNQQRAPGKFCVRTNHLPAAYRSRRERTPKCWGRMS